MEKEHTKKIDDKREHEKNSQKPHNVILHAFKMRFENYSNIK